jgi:starch-binding outer membrane protein, SusD/RagB family
MNIKKCTMKTKLLAIILFTVPTACRDFVTLDPPETTLSTATVFADEGTARAAVNRIYIEMTQSLSSFVSGETSFTNMGGLAADELANYNAFDQMEAFAVNEINPLNINIQSSWNQLYNLIYQTNSVLEGVEKSTGIGTDSKNQFLGEAKFMRAYLHFSLANFWGDVPWVSSTDYTTNAKASRTSIEVVYENIIKDLLDAKEKLTKETAIKIRPTRAAASALLARVYLYKQNYAAAEGQASEVLGQPFQLETDLTATFLINSRETIWHLQSIAPGFNTWDGDTFILVAPPSNVALSNTILNEFELNDNRKTNWINSYSDGNDTWYFPFKYKVRRLPEATSPKTEYQVMLRLAEQYLIRAEARANLNNLSGALEDINIIRSRAGLAQTSAATKEQLLAAIEQERRVELFAENAHRWLDLKRTNRLDAVIGPTKPQWQSTDALFPLPQGERNRNNNLSQNPGY